MPPVLLPISEGTKILKAKCENLTSRFFREDAPQRTLDEVRERYGIHRSEPPTHPFVNPASIAPKKPTKQQPRPMASLVPSIPTPLAPVARVQSDTPLELVRHPSIPAGGTPSDNQCFHYLIRIAECALTLHCEVNADNKLAARNRVERIPNLLEWRELAGDELAEILKNERASKAG